MILDMMRWNVPPALMAACVLLQFNSKAPDAANVDFVELFCGDAAVSASVRAVGLIGSSHDVDNGLHYDLTRTSGFLWLRINYRRLSSCPGLLSMIRRARAGGFVMVALCCNSFSAMTLGGRAQSFIAHLGREALRSEMQCFLLAMKDVHMSG